jgi:hypothetical protein
MKAKSTIRVPAVALACALLLASPAFARESTDVIVMANGDHLTGQVKGLKEGVLYVSMTYILGTSSVQWSEVAQLESKQLFLVKTQDGSVYTGTLNTANTPSGRPVEIEVVESPGQEVDLAQSRIVELDMTSAKFFQRFNGSVNTGITYSKGNQSTHYNIGTQVSYPRERWAAGASFNSTLSSSTGASASARNQVTTEALHLMRWNNWFYEGIGDFLQSSEQGILSQATFGGGVGRYLKNSNLARISVVGGLAGQNTQYQQKIASQNLTSALFVANLQFFRFNKTNGDLTALLLPVLSEPGRVKFNMNASYYVKLTGNLSWNVSVYGS